MVTKLQMFWITDKFKANTKYKPKRSPKRPLSAGAKELEPPSIQVWGRYNWDLGAKPTAGSRSRVPGQGDMGRGPLKLKHFWLLNVQWKPQICPLLKNWKCKKLDTICVVFAKNEV